MQQSVKNFVIGRAVPFVGTSGLQFEKTEEDHWTAFLPNRPEVQNHLGQIHACGMVLLAESIAILIVAMNLPADKLPLVKNIQADFVKRSTGGMRGNVKLNKKQIEYIQTAEKGEMLLEVEIMDKKGVQPIKIVVNAVWIPKKKKD